MLKLDEELLTELGLATLPAHDKNLVLKLILEMLERRVGAALTESMPQDVLQELDDLIEANDEAGVHEWLDLHHPGRAVLVHQELDRLKVEIQAVAPSILAEVGADPRGTEEAAG